MESKYDEEMPYVDLLSVTDTYIDGIHLTAAGASVARIILTVSRPAAPAADDLAPTANRMTAVRLAMPTTAFVQIYNRMHQVITVLADSGAVIQQGSDIKQTKQYGVLRRLSPRTGYRAIALDAHGIVQLNPVTPWSRVGLSVGR
jgi:hypothetical protein